MYAPSAVQDAFISPLNSQVISLKSGRGQEGGGIGVVTPGVGLFLATTGGLRPARSPVCTKKVAVATIITIVTKQMACDATVNRQDFGVGGKRNTPVTRSNRHGGMRGLVKRIAPNCTSLTPNK